MRRLSPSVLFLFLIFRLMAYAADPVPAPAASKTAPDLLLFNNGDRLTGKLMHSTGSDVIFQSDMAGEVTVSWSKVKELRSQRQFVVLSKDKHFSWRRAADVPTGSITVEQEKISLKTLQETQVIPIKNTADVLDRDTFDHEALFEGSILRRWKGAVNLGTTLVEATQHTTSVNGSVALVRAIPSVNYLPPRNRSTIDFNGSYGRITQPQAAGAPVQPDVKTAIYHGDAERDLYLSTRVYLLAQTAFDHNFSQGLDLQQIYGAGVGWTVVKRQNETLDLKATLQYEKQAFLATTSQENTNLVGSTFSITYLRKLPHDIVLQQQLQYLPAYNHPRAYSAFESNSFSFPLHKRFSFVIGTQDSYLNNPPVQQFPDPVAKQNSFQFTTGISYTLK